MVIHRSLCSLFDHTLTRLFPATVEVISCTRPFIDALLWSCGLDTVRRDWSDRLELTRQRFVRSRPQCRQLRSPRPTEGASVSAILCAPSIRALETLCDNANAMLYKLTLTYWLL